MHPGRDHRVIAPNGAVADARTMDTVSPPMVLTFVFAIGSMVALFRDRRPRPAQQLVGFALIYGLVGALLALGLWLSAPAAVVSGVVVAGLAGILLFVFFPRA
jgi:FtsH-binding integral membrane protein